MESSTIAQNVIILWFIFVGFIQSSFTMEERCPQFVCPTVVDDVTGRKIQLVSRLIERPPVLSLEQFGIRSDMTYWSCKKPDRVIIGDTGAQRSIAIFDVDNRQFDRLPFKDVAAYSISYDRLDNMLYWLNIEDGVSEVRRGILDNGDWNTIVTVNSNGYNSVIFDNQSGFIYWSEKDNVKKIKRMPVNGTVNDVETVISQSYYPRTLVIRQATRQLYWNSESGIYRSLGMDSWSVSKLTSLCGPHVIGLTLNEKEGKMYFTFWIGNAIAEASIDGGPFKHLVETNSPRNIVFLQGVILCLHDLEKKIGIYNLENGNVQIPTYLALTEDLDRPRGFTSVPPA